jgi:seryl-tRNA synthetase
MLSRQLLRERFEEVSELLMLRGTEPGMLDEWRRLDRDRRATLVEVENLKNQRNEASKAIGKIKQGGGDAAEEIAQVASLKGEVEALENRLAAVDGELRHVELRLPNVPDSSVPHGADEGANRVERVVGTPAVRDFEPKPHWEVGTDLGILDFERAAKLAGARFVVYRGAGAQLERALISFMLRLHSQEHGYEEIIPPYIVNEDSLLMTTQLPKFEEDLFKLEGTSYYLSPTSEVQLANLHRGEVLEEAELPLRYTAFTPCFRAEAGSYGRDVRGLIRLHQFHKVELVQLTHPDRSEEALEEIAAQAEKVLQLLELPYRVLTLSTGDMGFGSARTYDLEVWLPAQGEYREISSCSNCRDFQARRGDIRFRPSDGGRTRLVHTLNGSALAAGRTTVAILENYQQADGSVVVPEVLRPWMGGVEKIEKK